MEELEELEEVKPYSYYKWDCPSCGSVMELENFGQGDEEKCEGCSEAFILRG